MEQITKAVDLSSFAHLLTPEPTAGTEWNESRYDAVKAEIKKYYSIYQEDYCVYCKIRLNFAGYGEPIEHIVPKDDKPQWMFKPMNLALSCYPCNTKKHAKNTVTSAGLRLVNYPGHKDYFVIYHPHFDRYSTHILAFREFFLIPRTEKGRTTFEVCNLYRLELPINKARQKFNDDMDLKTKVIDKTLKDKNATPEVIEQCTRIATAIIQRATERARIMKGKKR